MRARPLWLGAALAAAAGCQASAPQLPPPPARLQPGVLERIRLERSAPEQPLVPIRGVAGRSGATPISGATSGGEAPQDPDAPRGVAAHRLELEDVLASVERHFPLILAAQQEIALAESRALQARGGFDTKLKAKGRSDALGYYQNDRIDVGLEQPTRLWGTTFSGGYRVGTGDFPSYDGFDKTNDSGELRLGLSVPLLQGRAIDPRRVAEWRARIERERAEPLVLQKRLDTTRKAAEVYWRWVSWGQSREIARLLLALAENRQAQIERAVEEGQFAPIAIADNQRSIVDRRAKLVSVQRKLEKAGIELSLYWRDPQGFPIVPNMDEAPVGFPPPRDPELVLVPGDIELALARRPEIRALELELEALRLDRSLAENSRLPSLELGVQASQDFGAAANDPDDKEDLELKALVTLDVPLQRRKAIGKQREVEAKIAKVERELQYSRELTTSAVQDAVSALVQSWEGLLQARENVRLANVLAEAERVQLRAGESDLFRVNVREQQAALAAAGEVESLEAHFDALVRYRVVLGIPFQLGAEEAPGSPAQGL